MPGGESEQNKGQGFQQCTWWSLRSQTQGCPLLSLQPLSVTTFGISQLPWASRACQHHFLSFVLYYQLAVSSQTHQSCYTKMENMVNVPLRASRTSLSRASILNADDAALVGGSFFHKLFRRAQYYLFKGQNRYNGWNLFREVKVYRMKQVKLRSLDSCHSHGKETTSSAFGSLHALEFCPYFQISR